MPILFEDGDEFPEDVKDVVDIAFDNLRKRPLKEQLEEVQKIIFIAGSNDREAMINASLLLAWHILDEIKKENLPSKPTAKKLTSRARTAAPR